MHGATDGYSDTFEEDILTISAEKKNESDALN